METLQELAPVIETTSLDDNLRILNALLEDEQRLSQNGGNTAAITGSPFYHDVFRLKTNADAAEELNQKFKAEATPGEIQSRVIKLTKEELELKNKLEGIVTPDDEQLTTGEQGDGQPTREELLDKNNKLEERIKELEYKATHDELTKLPNRHGLEEYLSKLSPETMKDTVAIFVDITNFKAINDKLGHDYGDSALTKVASRLHEGIFRGYDIVARLGGDEFLILLAPVNRYGQRLSPDERLASAESRIPAEEQKLLNEDPNLDTVGFGLAFGGAIGYQCVDEQGVVSIDAMKKTADANMIAHKEQQHKEKGAHRPTQIV